MISCDDGGRNGTALVLFSLKNKRKHCLIEATMKFPNCGGALGTVPKPPALVFYFGIFADVCVGTKERVKCCDIKAKFGSFPCPNWVVMPE